MITGMQKLDALMMAMAYHEGWQSPLDTKTPGGSRAFRNHNPGNLRSSIFASGEQDGYAVFKNDHIGWIALHYDILKKARGETSTGLNGKSTIRELIFKYAPAGDNNSPEAYLKSICSTNLIKEDDTLESLFR